VFNKKNVKLWTFICTVHITELINACHIQPNHAIVAPLFFHGDFWRCIKGSDKLKCCITGNKLLWVVGEGGAIWWWGALYRALTIFKLIVIQVKVVTEIAGI
jgi:hypothetical protein